MTNPPDYGCDPMGDGTFRMVPSGDIVSAAEKEARLKARRRPSGSADCLGLTWSQLAMAQGGLQTLDVTRKGTP